LAGYLPVHDKMTDLGKLLNIAKIWTKTLAVGTLFHNEITLRGKEYA